MIVVVVLVLAGLAVLGAVVALALGRGGELTWPRPDHPPLPSAEDGLLPRPGGAPPRLPRAMFGYQTDVTDHAIGQLRQAVWERDARLAALEEQVADLHRRLNERSGPPAPDAGWPPIDLTKDERDRRDEDEFGDDDAFLEEPEHDAAREARS
ncbi:hypothetical protein [Actinomadura sp. 21ATH]|uniref:hypothetical protein n=1 Tax=Actinomadura sp. 21ATH TaxID=1735444 RepID=UPI0035C11C56